MDDALARAAAELTRLLAERPEAPPKEPAALIDDIADALRRLGDPARRDEEVQAFAERVRPLLRALDLPEDLADLPERARKLSTDRQAVAQGLRGLADLLEAPAGGAPQTDAIERWIRELLGPRPDPDAARQARVEAAARADIAAALRKYGFDDEDDEEDEPAE